MASALLVMAAVYVAREMEIRGTLLTHPLFTTPRCHRRFEQFVLVLPLSCSACPCCYSQMKTMAPGSLDDMVRSAPHFEPCSASRRELGPSCIFAV